MRTLARICLVAAVLAVVPACQRDVPESREAPVAPAAQSERAQSHVAPQQLHTLSPASLTEAERRFGRGPTPHPSIVYQPEVVIVGGGAKSVRALHANGLGCSIDARAPRAADLRVGGIAFITSRCVGRVLAIDRRGTELALVLGPVEITEIIREGHFRLDQPLDLDDTLIHEAPEWPGKRVDVASLLASGSADYDPRYIMPASLAGRDGAALHRVSATSVGDAMVINRKMIGLSPTLKERGIVFNGLVGLQVKAPQLAFVLDISGGQVVQCELQLRGTAGFIVKFEAGAEPGGFTNASLVRDVPVDITIPIGGHLPFEVLITQRYFLNTGFSANSSFLKTSGEFTFNGALSMGYQRPKWTVAFPGGFSTKIHPAEGLNGVSLGTMALVLTHQVKIMVGVGAFGFATGPYMVLNSSFTAARSPDTQGGQFGGPTLRGLAPCNQTTLGFGLGAGVGYMIPKKITDLINAVLSALNIKYQVKSSGGIESDPLNLKQWKGWSPKDVAVCQMT